MFDFSSVRFTNSDVNVESDANSDPVEPLATYSYVDLNDDSDTSEVQESKAENVEDDADTDSVETPTSYSYVDLNAGSDTSEVQETTAAPSSDSTEAVAEADEDTQETEVSQVSLQLSNKCLRRTVY